MTNIPKHIAIIMDGNRRWAKKRGLPSSMGHAEGANTLEKIADDCSDLGIKYLTVYAFSTENWKRSEEEVDYLMNLLAKHIKDFDKRIKNRDIRFRLVGDINRLNKDLQDGIRGIEERTKDKQGENRLSGFLLWQAAYSELYFTDVLWPDFDKKELEKAINEYNNRKRNFGA